MASGKTPTGAAGTAELAVVGCPAAAATAAAAAAAAAAAGAGDKITWRRVPLSSTICCRTWPGGTWTGSGTGGDPVETIRTVAGPAIQRILFNHFVHQELK